MDLLDLAAAEALSHGAAVHVCARDHVPSAADAAAILRY
jgi:hypothetical protein